MQIDGGEVLLVGKYGSSQTQFVGCRSLLIDQQVAVRSRRGIRERFFEILRTIRINLPSQMSDLGGIARIFEQHEIMRVETDRSVFFASVVQVLTDVYDAGDVVMRSLRELVGNSAVGFSHQIVDYQKRPSTVEQIRTGQTFDEFDAIRKFVEQFALEFTVIPHYSFGRLVNHRAQVF